jgi:RNA-directed DNA polymerase
VLTSLGRPQEDDVVAQRPRNVLIRLNQIMRGWSTYFRHAVAKHTLNPLGNFV